MKALYSEPNKVLISNFKNEKSEIFSHKSLKNKIWLWRKKENLHTIKNKLSIISTSLPTNFQLLIAEILSSRDATSENLQNYFNPKVKNIMPSPNVLKDMEKSVLRVFKAIKNKEKIVICGDYDVDGATSSALIFSILKHFDCDLEIFIPDRLKDGYGPNAKKILQKFGKDKKGVLITLDCGATAHEPLAEIAKYSIDTIVIDHHLSDEKLPCAYGIINPNRKDENQKELGFLAAVGVTFLFCVALIKQMKKENFFTKYNLSIPNLLEMLDLVALGTICDVVPLHGLNRAYVNSGLKILNKPNKRIGIQSLLDAAMVPRDKIITSYELGFIIGPRINAGGRIGDSTIGVKILTTKSQMEATKLANQLETLNIKRKDVETKVTIDAMKQVKNNKNKFILAVGENWHPGVIGIVAGRLKDEFSLPSFVITFYGDNDLEINKNSENKIGKASARGISQCDVGNIIKTAVEKNILIGGGGHKMAGGFSIKKENIEKFKKHVKESLKHIDMTSCLKIDTSISLSAINDKLWSALEQLQPFGASYPTPKFLFTKLRVIKSKIVGNDHISCILSDGKKSIQAICFRAKNTPLEKTLLHSPNSLINVVGQISLNIWNDKRNYQIIIDDVMVL